MVLSKEEINCIAAETRVPENIVKNIVEADGGERSAEEIRDTILDMFRERGTSDLGPSGDPSRRTISPEEAVRKLERLCNMLAKEPEFEARYPEAHEELFTPPFLGIGSEHREGTGLSLPSFRARILRNAPKSVTQGDGGPTSPDAYSASSFHAEMGETPTSQSPLQVDEGYLRGIILAVMSREEYRERIDSSRRYRSVPKEAADALISAYAKLANPLTQDQIDLLCRPNFSEGDGSGVPEASYVRLTDYQPLYRKPRVKYFFF